MFDIKIIRENPDLVKKDLVKRNDTEKIKWVDETIKLDKSWRSSIQELNELRRRRNNITQEIAKLKKWGENAEKILKEAEDIPQKIKNLEEKTQEYQEKMDYYLMRLPNILHESVPLGKDDSENAEIRRVGKTPKFDFEPKNHLDLMQNLNLIEVDRAAKVSGHGFFYLKNDLARLDLAIVQYAIDLMMKRGYTFVIPPYMIHKEPFIGVTDFEFFEEQIYKIEKEDLYLIATAEHPLGAIFKDEILNKDDMPFKFCGFSPCFRKEVGAHGKYTKGLFRMHHFHKIEQFIFCHPDDSWGLHEELQKNSKGLRFALSQTALHLLNPQIGMGVIWNPAPLLGGPPLGFGGVMTDGLDVISAANNPGSYLSKKQDKLKELYDGNLITVQTNAGIPPVEIKGPDFRFPDGSTI